jgi:transient receptor potential cation channel subfamily V member 5
MFKTRSNGSEEIARTNENLHYGIYKIIGIQGGGILVDLMRDAMKSKNYNELDDYIKNEVVKYLYNDGDGELVKTKKKKREKH